MRAVAFAFVVTMALAGGCVLFTGSTDGYSVLDSGSSSCTSSASCVDAGFCCLMVTSFPTSAAATNGMCLPSCSIAFPQLCLTNAECGDTGPCSMQTCVTDAGGSLPFSLRACGTVPNCVTSP
jgi:hypothetical protein